MHVVKEECILYVHGELTNTTINENSYGEIQGMRPLMVKFKMILQTCLKTIVQFLIGQFQNQLPLDLRQLISVPLISNFRHSLK